MTHSAMRGLFLAACAVLLALGGMGARARTADIVIGVPNWPSVNVTAHIIKVVLESNYGLQVELQSASNPVIFEGMARGSMQIHPEVWLPNQQSLYDKAGASVVLNRHPATGMQGICANRVARELGIRDIADLGDPGKARLLDTDGDGRGELFIGAPGWSSTLIERLKAVAYGYDQILSLHEIDEGLADSQLNVAARRGLPWAGYCYTPHHRFIIHPDLALLTQPAYDAARWRAPAQDADAATAQQASVAMAWPPQSVQPAYAKSLVTTFPMAATLIDNLDLRTEDLSTFTYELVINRRDAADFAAAWVGANPERVARWLR